MGQINVHLIACIPGQQLTVMIKNFFLGYQSTPSHTSCVPCAAGFYCPDARFVNYFFFATRVTKLMYSIWTHRKYFLLFSNPPVPCPTGMFSLGGRFENCTACPAGSACPDPAGAPVACTGGNKLCTITKNYLAHNSLFS